MKKSSITSRIPDRLTDYSKPIFTPKDEEPEVLYSPEEGWLDEPVEQFTQQFVEDLHQTMEEYGTPTLSRSEAEEQMHLTELRRLAEAYTENDAIVISQVLAKKYPYAMFNALGNEFYNIKSALDAVTGAVNVVQQQ